MKKRPTPNAAEHISPQKLMLIGVGLMVVPVILGYILTNQTQTTSKAMLFLCLYFWPAGVILIVVGLVLYIRQLMERGKQK